MFKQELLSALSARLTVVMAIRLIYRANGDDGDDDGDGDGDDDGDDDGDGCLHFALSKPLSLKRWCVAHRPLK